MSAEKQPRIFTPMRCFEGRWSRWCFLRTGANIAWQAGRLERRVGRCGLLGWVGVIGLGVAIALSTPVARRSATRDHHGVPRPRAPGCGFALWHHPGSRGRDVVRLQLRRDRRADDT